MKFRIAFVVFLFAASCICNGQTWEWGRVSSQANWAEGWSTTTDDEGNVYGAGWFDGGPMIIGNDTTSPTSNAANIVITKFDRFGNLLLLKSAWTMALFRCYDIVVDNDHNIYITGFTSGHTLHFGTDSLFVSDSTSYKTYVVKLDAAGNFNWGIIGQDNSGNYGFGIAKDNTGNIYVGGYYWDRKLVFGTDSILNFNQFLFFNHADGYILKLSPQGNVLMLKSIGGYGDDIIHAIEVDNEQNIYITGSFISDPCYFDTVTLYKANYVPYKTDVFVAKLASTGSGLWARAGGGSLNEIGECIAVDNGGNVFAGSYSESDTIIFDTDTLFNTSVGTNYVGIPNADGFLSKYDSSGNLQWVKQTGGLSDERIHDAVTDHFGNVYVSGRFGENDTTALLIDTTIIPAPLNCNQPSFIALFNPDGDLICTKTLDATGDDKLGISINNYGDVFICGDVHDTDIVVGNDTLYLSGDDESFFVAAFHSCVSCSTVPSTVTTKICKGETYTLPDGTVTDTAGQYISVINGLYGCDSVVTTNLSIDTTNTDIVTTGWSASATLNNGAYQWIDCNNNFANIPGATSQNFVPSFAGNFAVVITYNGCTDTSGCIFISSTDEIDFSNTILIYPNPVSDWLVINNSQFVVNVITVTDILGRAITTIHEPLTIKNIIDVSNFSPGIYFIEIKTQSGVFRKKIVVE